MGNTLGRKKTAKVMKIDGEIMKLKTPLYANEVLKNYPSMVLLESESVKHFGVRARPLEPQQELKPKRLYFLVELPKIQEEIKGPRRVRSGIQMSAKDRLETLMLARRSSSDLSIMKPTSSIGSDGGAVRLKLKLPKAEVEKLMSQSKDEAEVAEKIMQLCMGKDNGGNMFSGPLMDEQRHNNGGLMIKKVNRSRDQKRVGFLPITEGEIQLAVAS